jgi:hypothetical protein
MSNPRTLRIRALNDTLRRTFTGGRILLTPGLLALPPALQADILIAVQTFTDFSPDNDPYGEHDFGSMTLAGETIFWKIDYYDPEGCMGSSNPADPAQTLRVLTIFLAEEY